MNRNPQTVSIVTTAHWERDARLNRHTRYLSQIGVKATVLSYAEKPRLRALIAVLRQVASKPATTVILPDPETYLLGSIIARARGIRTIIDIHEDYTRVAHGRDWVPRPARSIVALIARIMVRMGRMAAADVIVAAPDIARSGDVIVMNLPDPALMSRLAEVPVDDRSVVYVGDVTRPRGALEMIRVLGALDPHFELRIVGRVNDSLRSSMIAEAQALGVSGRIRFEGRLPLEEAWERAAGSVAGLNLLHDLPAYRTAVATKLWEYLAAGIPPIVTDLPGQASLVSQIDHRLVCTSPKEAAQAIELLAAEPQLRSEIVSRGVDLVRETWDGSRPDVALQDVVSPGRSP